jgi:hypothetical protein
MTTYDFNYKDREGDEFQSNDHSSLSEAKKAYQKLKQFDDEIYITETWIYTDGEFKGRW